MRDRAPCSAHDEPTQTATIAPDDVLALAADVEHAAAEGERDREPGEDQRRRQQQRLLEVVARGVRSGRRAVVNGVDAVATWKNQFSPVPLKIAWYVVSGLWPVASTTRPPMKNARRAVITGVTTPPARW